MASLARPDRFQSEAALNLMCGLLGWSSPVYVARIRIGAAPLGDPAVGEFVLFVSYISCGLALPISPFFLLLLEEFGLQLQHLTPTPSSRRPSSSTSTRCSWGGPLYLPLLPLLRAGQIWEGQGPPWCLLLLDKAGFGRRLHLHLRRARWENWRDVWVIASAEANDRLALPSDRPSLDRKHWRTKSSLSPELLPVLDRIKTLATGGLTSMHVVGDFLKRWVMSLQRRSRICCWFTGLNDIGRIQHGSGTDLSWEELEVLVKGITGESFVPESLILPQDILALCDDPGLRTAVLAMLLTLDESGVAVRQTGGRDPLYGIQIHGVLAGVPSPPVGS
jgi:hypothetical protein